MEGLSFAKGKPTRAFMTWGQVEREIRIGGLTEAAAGELWENLWLDIEQVREFLAATRVAKAPPWFAPMVVAAAFTGARRSELCRSQRADWNLEASAGRVRQKKRDRDREFSFREVPIHADLAAELEAWFARHPGGPHAFAQPDGSEVTWSAAAHQFRAAVAGTGGEPVRGWHVLRHSFASNLASRGADQRFIDAWMGHSTLIRLRYQHLRPKDQQDAIAML